MLRALPPGALDISVLGMPADADLWRIRCHPPDGRTVPDVIDLDAGALTVTLDPGSVTRCSLVARAPSSIAQVEVVTEPPGAVPDTTLTISGYPGPIPILSGGPRLLRLPVVPAPDVRTLTLSDIPDGYELSAIACDQLRGDPGTSSTDVATATVSLALPNAAWAECTFTLEALRATVNATVETDRADPRGSLHPRAGGPDQDHLPG